MSQTTEDVSPLQGRLTSLLLDLNLLCADELKRVKKEYNGHVVLNNDVGTPQAKGRLCLVTSVTYSRRHGFMYLCQPFKLRPSGIPSSELLHGDAWTRTYRPKSQFTFKPK